MADKTDGGRPDPDSPEFKEWLYNKCKPFAEKLLSSEAPEEDTYLCGPVKGEKLTPEKMVAEDIAIDKLQARSHLKSVK